jgi:NTE family protein
VPIDQPTLDRDLRRLYGTGDFEHVNYRLLEEPGKRILSVDAVEKSWGPNYLRFGLGLTTDFRGDAYFNLLASYRMTWLNSLGGEWRNDVQVGRTSRIATQFYQPIERSQTFFVAPSLSYERRTVDVFSANQRIARYDILRGSPRPRSARSSRATASCASASRAATVASRWTPDRPRFCRPSGARNTSA